MTAAAGTRGLPAVPGAALGQHDAHPGTAQGPRAALHAAAERPRPTQRRDPLHTGGARPRRRAHVGRLPVRRRLLDAQRAVAGEVELSRGDDHTAYRVRELSDDETAPVLRRYLSTPARLFVGRQIRDASRPHPVFELTPHR